MIGQDSEGLVTQRLLICIETIISLNATNFQFDSTDLKFLSNEPRNIPSSSRFPLFFESIARSYASNDEPK